MIVLLGLIAVAGVVVALGVWIHRGFQEDDRRFEEDRRKFRMRAAETMRGYERTYRERAAKVRPEQANAWSALADKAAACAREYEGRAR